MPTSGTFTFNPASDDLLTEAWERLGKSPAEITGEVARSARRSLQYLLIDWTNRNDINLWQVDQQSLPVAQGVSAYTLPIGTVEPLEVTITVGGVERVLAPISRDQWAAIPVKATPGVPTQYWTDRGSYPPVLRLYPQPAAAYTGQYYRLRLPQDIGALGNQPDAPILWADALAYGLAARLAIKYAPDRAQGLAALAEDARVNANGENRNRVPLRIGVRRRW